MNTKKDLKRVAASRYVEFSGYKNKAIKRTRMRNQTSGMLFSLAPVIVMGIFVFASFIIGLMMVTYSGTLDPGMNNLKQVGFKNFSLISKDTLLVPAIKNSLIYMGVTTSLGMAAALVLAFLINSKHLVGKKIFLVGYFLPQVTSAVAGAIIFYKLFGISGALSTELHPERAIWIVVISGTWLQIAGVIVNFNTAFANIGTTEYEAAELDGAKAITKFFKITIPALMPIIIYQLLTGIIAGMSVFGQSYILLQMDAVHKPEYLITWSSLGFLRSIGGAHTGIKTNVGLGMIELILLGVTTLVISLVANRIQPISGKKGDK